MSVNKVASPTVFEILETPGFLNTLEAGIQTAVPNEGELLLKYPVVYIHQWKKAGQPLHEIYIGETNNIIERTKEHYANAKNPKAWQKRLVADGVQPTMYVIGHPHFNKSLTLDIENRLIEYAMGMSTLDTVYNGRGNPQSNYYPVKELDDIFSKIWGSLRRKNKDLFLSESEIKDSAIFKASPLHKLTDEQLTAKQHIKERVYAAINSGERGQLIFVEGEAGTGKTVLNSSTFYDLVNPADQVYEKPLQCALLVNHEEQITVYKEIARKLHITDTAGDDVVSKPTHFILSNPTSKPKDVVFIDEAHLLLTQGKQSYTGRNQLEDIIARARVTVVMFDPNQVLTTEEYWEKDAIDKIRQMAIKQNNHIELKHQLRITCDPKTMVWLDDITQKGTIGKLGRDDEGYEVKVFDSPDALYKAIKQKANNEHSRLSRLIATYDWDYNQTQKKDGSMWGVQIGNFFLPWNYELERTLSNKEKRKIKNLAWAEQTQTIGEVGSTFTIQGFDLSYAGVIIGPSVIYRNGKIQFVPSESKNKKATQKRTLSDGSKESFGEELLRHELRVLLTRGVKGLYIYAVDNELNKALKAALI